MYRKLSKSEKKVSNLLKKIETISKEPDFKASIFAGAYGNMYLMLNPTDKMRAYEYKHEETLECRVAQTFSIPCD